MGSEAFANHSRTSAPSPRIQRRLRWLWLSALWWWLPVQAEVWVLTEHSPPGEYLDASGRVTGPTAEMVRELMRRVGHSGEIELLPWKRAYGYALAGPQVALFETARTPEREALFKWVGPIKRIHWGLYDRQERAKPLHNLDEARRVQTLCAYIGDGKGEYLLQQGFSNLYQPVLSAQCLDMLLHGRVDLWLSSDIGKDALAQEQGLAADALVSVLEVATLDLYIAFSLGTPDDIVQRWQATLDQMKRDGTLGAYYRGTYSEALIAEMSQVHQPATAKRRSSEL